MFLFIIITAIKYYFGSPIPRCRVDELLLQYYVFFPNGTDPYSNSIFTANVVLAGLVI